MFLCECFGNLGLKLSKRANKVPEEYLKPQGLYSADKVDLRKLRRLILDGKLAPCYPGREECPEGAEQQFEECPICFLQYPVLNTSKCCNKRVCTECFLQVQTSTPQGVVPSCPFCKVSNYTAKFMGARSTEELESDRLEEQKVLEARIREREEEIQRDQERALARLQQQQQQQQQSTVAPAVAPNQSATASSSTPPAAVVTPVASPAPLSTQHNSTQESRASATQTVDPRPEERTVGENNEAQSSPDAGDHEHRRHGGRSNRRHRPQHQHDNQQRRYRLADFVPNTIVDMSVSVEDINDYMLEQALYDSIAANSGGRAGAVSPGPISPGQVSLTRLTSPTSMSSPSQLAPEVREGFVSDSNRSPPTRSPQPRPHPRRVSSPSSSPPAPNRRSNSLRALSPAPPVQSAPPSPSRTETPPPDTRAGVRMSVEELAAMPHPLAPMSPSQPDYRSLSSSGVLPDATAPLVDVPEEEDSTANPPTTVIIASSSTSAAATPRCQSNASSMEVMPSTAEVVETEELPENSSRSSVNAGTSQRAGQQTALQLFQHVSNSYFDASPFGSELGSTRAAGNGSHNSSSDGGVVNEVSCSRLQTVSSGTPSAVGVGMPSQTSGLKDDKVEGAGAGIEAQPGSTVAGSGDPAALAHSTIALPSDHAAVANEAVDLESPVAVAEVVPLRGLVAKLGAHGQIDASATTVYVGMMHITLDSSAHVSPDRMAQSSDNAMQASPSSWSLSRLSGGRQLVGVTNHEYSIDSSPSRTVLVENPDGSVYMAAAEDSTSSVAESDHSSSKDQQLVNTIVDDDKRVVQVIAKVDSIAAQAVRAADDEVLQRIKQMDEQLRRVFGCG